ncbi:uncharacterized protein N7482_010571 [Penicillium canariense]|uniref:Choline monooxygenase, chloroplastic n=1 Tax=Penicillium canariense TaxID=189055 RepID=A0A9W9HPG4_9EURO|nr:uncharacterized protein N7482_010571 [Penicillium canariense]KAJ5151319.1 hypothetical protein N7482_010571 [Penicillium canariense]
MSAILKSDLGFEEAAGVKSSKDESSPLTALPLSWYTAPEIYELERRAVFSRNWLLTTHSLRFSKTGDWLRYNVAGFSFILVRNKEGAVNAFHNVCRHRAFPVVTEDGGTSRIFSCKYHGWSYGLNGKLAKAPGYQDLEGFDKSKNGLLPIHVHTDVNGFIWVNLDGSEKPEISWEDESKGIDPQSRFQAFNFEDYTFNHTWEMDGEYNWKILADKYNERHNGQTPRLDVPCGAGLSSDSDENTQSGSIIHEPNTTPAQHGLKIASTYYFPNATMTVSPNVFVMQRLVPTAPTSCSMRFEVYRNKNATDEDFELVNSMLKRIVSEDKTLGVNIQQNLNTSGVINGEPHPRLEDSPLNFQTVVKDIVIDFHKREEEVGHEIWPSRQTLPSEAKTSQDDIDFCSKLQNQSQANADCSSQVGGCRGGVACQSGNEALAY